MLELNKVYNMDCIEGMKQLEDNSVDFVLTDIPYNEVNRKSNGLKNLYKGLADTLSFDLDAFLPELMRITRGGGVHILWDKAILYNY